MNRLQHSQQTIMVAKYIEHGVKTCIISHYTQLSAKYIRALMKEITGKASSSGQLIQVPRLFKSRCAAISSILLISIYHKVSPLTEQPRLVDLDLLIKVYEHFVLQVAHHQDNQPIITINDAWVLIDAYLNHDITLQPCDCGKVTVTSNAYEFEQSCPFCALKEQHHFNLKGLKSVSVS